MWRKSFETQDQGSVLSEKICICFSKGLGYSLSETSLGSQLAVGGKHRVGVGVVSELTLVILQGREQVFLFAGAAVTKDQKLDGLKQHTYSFMVLEARSLKLRCQ